VALVGRYMVVRCQLDVCYMWFKSRFCQSLGSLGVGLLPLFLRGRGLCEKVQVGPYSKREQVLLLSLTRIKPLITLLLIVNPQILELKIVRSHKNHIDKNNCNSTKMSISNSLLLLFIDIIQYFSWSFLNEY